MMMGMLKILRVFLYDIKQEVKKISWVKRRDVFPSLFIVILVIVCFSLFFGFMDFMSLCLIKALFGIVYDV